MIEENKNKKLSYSEVVKLLPSQFDLNDRLSPTAIMGLFQDIASIHGELIGVGFEKMLSKGLYWVLIRTKYDVIVQPKPYQQVVLKTWPHIKGRVDFDRDYLITDMSGNILIKGTSKWCVISTETRKFVLPTAVEYPKDLEYETEINYQEKFAKTPSIQQKQDADYEHVVEFNEIDHNKHLNNVHYATYVFNALKNDDLSHLQLNYISECKLGDKIKLYVEKVEDEMLVSGYVDEELKFTACAK